MASRRVRSFPRGLAALLLLLIFLLGLRPAAGHGRQPEPPPKRESREEFRIEKLNQLWEKARRLHLPPVRLAELPADLKMQERDELAWKKLKLKGLDEDGRRSETHTQPQCHPGQDTRQVTSNSLSDAQEDGLGDPRLEKLWHKAKTSGKFSSEELDELWREFLYHKEKVHEYNVLLDSLSRTEEIHENVISPSDLSDIKGDVLHSRHMELKERLHSINQGLDHLGRLSHQGYDTEAEFEEPRVIDLPPTLTEKELEALREELKPFEAKIEKHNHYQKQLEIVHEKLKHAESVGNGELVSRSLEKHALLDRGADQAAVDQATQ
ncbi:Alpha-2-macroglobulin receptor-associated protein [Saguinus oedipus]|uniref:Alpha-2-macroglobulin receptor-associated protein n=1 Tax=Saguinus oedipus TaxID=9490 RepID=A0ABQ9UY42_SAGOE|nr:Alpha-2-macroglobulin receptor-associated protein [Saguinus oedipus]